MAPASGEFAKKGVALSRRGEDVFLVLWPFLKNKIPRSNAGDHRNYIQQLKATAERNVGNARSAGALHDLSSFLFSFKSNRHTRATNATPPPVAGRRGIRRLKKKPKNDAGFRGRMRGPGRPASSRLLAARRVSRARAPKRDHTHERVDRWRRARRTRDARGARAAALRAAKRRGTTNRESRRTAHSSWRDAASAATIGPWPPQTQHTPHAASHRVVSA